MPPAIYSPECVEEVLSRKFAKDGPYRGRAAPHNPDTLPLIRKRGVVAAVLMAVMMVVGSAFAAGKDKVATP